MKKAFNIRYAISTVLLLVLLNINTVFANASSMTLTVQMPYSVEISAGEHGKVSVDGIKYTGNATLMKDIGSEITYEVSANLLYKIDKVLYNGEDVTAKLADGKFTAPALTENATFKATFKFIIGGGSSKPATEPADSSEESSEAGTISMAASKPADTLVTDNTKQMKSNSKNSVSAVKKASEGTAVDSTNSPSDERDAKPEVQPGTETVTIPPTEVPKAADAGKDSVKIAIASGFVLLFGTGTFMYLKKKKEK